MNKKAKEDEETKEQKKQGEREWEPGKMRKGGKRKEEEEQAEGKKKEKDGSKEIKGIFWIMYIH